MPCTWLLTIALAAANSSGQEIATPQPPSKSTLATPTESKNPYARLFRFGSDDPKTHLQARRFRTVPGKQPARANDGAPVEGESVEIICGMTVVRRSPQIDRGIALPASRGTGIAVRRIEPDTCGASHPASPK
jgi:hypothetical protein